MGLKMRSLNFTFVFFVGYMWSIGSMLSTTVTEYSSRGQGENNMTTSTTTPGATDIPVNRMSPISGKSTQSDTTNTVAIAGGTTASAVFIATVVSLLVWIIRRYKKKNKDVQQNNLQVVASGSHPMAVNKRKGNIKWELNKDYVIQYNPCVIVCCCQYTYIDRDKFPSTSTTNTSGSPIIEELND